MSVDRIESYFDEGNEVVVKKVKSDFDEKRYLDTRLKIGEESRETRIRVLLTKDSDGKEKFAIPVRYHNLKVDKEVNVNGFKDFICLNDPHFPEEERKCPICKKIDELFNEANHFQEGSNERRSLCRKAYELKDSTRVSYFVRCIERGKEADGVKFWKINSWASKKGPYDVIKNLAIQRNNESKEQGYGPLNIFDYEKGFDFQLIFTRSAKSMKTEISISDVKFPSKLSNNPEEMERWINDPVKWDDMYKRKSEEYLKIIADNGVPYYDKEKGSLVDKSKQKELLMENRFNQEEADRILNNDTPKTDTTQESYLETEDYRFK